jgi:hypothetical protein
MKTTQREFLFKMFIRASGLEFETGRYTIVAPNYDDARKIFDSKDLPFQHFSTVESKAVFYSRTQTSII